MLPIVALLIGTSAAAPLVSDTVCEMSRRELPGWFCEIDANATGAIQPEQFVAYQMKLFDRLDKDADGVLTLDDYLQLADIPFLEGRHLPSIDVLRDHARRAFLGFDIDADRKLTRIEFEAGAWGVFETFDRNRDGKLTPDDWPLPSPVSRAPKPRSSPDINRDGVVDVNEFVTFETAPIWELDINRDGRIALEEWLRAAARWHEHSTHPAYLQRRASMTERFRQIDANKDGFISFGEARAMAIAQFERMDLNRDGMLTPEEWRRFHAPWDQPPLH